METRTPATFVDAIRYFSDPEVCFQTLLKIRWPDGVVKCPTCGSDKVHFLANQRRWKCSQKHPCRQFSIKVGTIFEDSPIRLDKWFNTIWLVANCKNGVSSYEIHRGIGVTQKTAWFMDHRIRMAMQAGSFDMLKGPIEADETFIGGLVCNMHWDKKDKIMGTGASGKEIVMGLLDRETGKARVNHVSNRKRPTLQNEIRENMIEVSESPRMLLHHMKDWNQILFMNLWIMPSNT